MNVLASYYGLPSLSLRDAVWPLMKANVPGYRVHMGQQCLPPESNPAKYCEDLRDKLASGGGLLSEVDRDSLLYNGELGCTGLLKTGCVCDCPFIEPAGQGAAPERNHIHTQT